MAIKESSAASTSAPSRSPWYYSWIRFKKNKLALSSAIFLVILGLLAIFAPFVTPTSYEDQKYLSQTFSFPDAENWMGVDPVGRDYYTRIIYGARVSLAIALSASLGTLLIGVPLGAIAGYKGGAADWIVMRFIETMAVIPPLLIGLVVAAIAGGGVMMIVLIAISRYWVRVARLVRGQVKSLKNDEYVMASRSFGAPLLYIMRAHLVPNAIAQILVGLVLVLPRAILLEAGLSFLGVGVNPPLPSWGQMINDGLYYIFAYWHLPLFPALALAVTILAFSIVGDGLRDALDPSLKGE